MNSDFAAACDVLAPMNLWIDPEGRIAHVGPTLKRLQSGAVWLHRPLLDLFEVERPHEAEDLAALFEAEGRAIRLRLREAPGTVFRGVLARVGRGAVLNLGFGIGIIDAVRDHRLSSRDFAPTDLTVEMLYLIEAKSAAMAASRQLNRRLQAARTAAEEQAFTDTLTGLKNRRALDHILAREIGGGKAIAVMQIDLDHFKAVNDTLGHAAGDHVLQQVARVMVSVTRDDDVVARIGGDEFVILFRGAIRRAQIERLARRIIRGIEARMLFEGQPCNVSASAGSVLSTDYETPDPATLLADADRALYASKRAGRAQHRFLSPGDPDEGDTDPRDMDAA